MFVVGAFVRRGRAVQEDQHDRHGAGGDEGPAGPDHLERGLPHGRQLPDFEEIAGMFACEGTFPNQDHLSRTDDDYVGWQYVAIHAYSVTLALTMAFSLGSLLTATAIRLEAKACFEGIMGDRGSRLPVIWQQVRRAVRQSEGGARRRAEAGDDAEGPVADREDCAASHGGRAREGALLFTGCILHPVAQTLLWLCVLCGVAACALLMSLIPKALPVEPHGDPGLLWHRRPGLPRQPHFRDLDEALPWQEEARVRESAAGPRGAGRGGVAEALRAARAR
ncbi:unnamed protein product [Prorocentrum cordatum]|uniref:Uncharacterized protein n=1 Tax=Prorocentrum cordatum TaxID=2364126 RepID=A0ABN9RK96_9DINO|nr:unnamed protein product [Polarella glacialis]